MFTNGLFQQKEVDSTGSPHKHTFVLLLFGLDNADMPTVHFKWKEEIL